MKRIDKARAKLDKALKLVEKYNLQFHAAIAQYVTDQEHKAEASHQRAERARHRGK